MGSLSAAKTVLVIDDHPIVREGITQLLVQQDDLRPCGSAAGCAEARRLVRELSPDVAVVDVSLGAESGLELIPLLLDDAPQMAILALSMHDETLYAKRALQAGARGYIMKHEGTDLLLAAIRTVVAGQIYVSPQMNARLLRSLSGTPRPRADASPRPIAELSNRELEIYRLVGQGVSTKEIAGLLFLSVKTVESHRTRIRQKLGLESSAALVAHAAEWVVRGSHVASGDTSDSSS